MTKPKNPRGELTESEIELVRLVARGLTDERIAALSGAKVSTVRSRVNAIYHHLGIAVSASSARGMTRTLLVIWAYENGYAGRRDPARSARERELAGRAFAVCRDMAYKRPVPLVREKAVAVIREADADLCGDEAA